MRLARSGDKRAEWVALHALGMLWSARDYERAGEYRRAALDASRAIGDAPLVAHSLNRVGNWFVNREDPHSGIPYHDEALAIFERAKDRRGIVETVDLLAMAYHIAGAQDTAVQLFERSIDLFEELEDRRGLANALAVLQVCGPSHHASAGPVGMSVRMSELLTSDLPIRLAAEIGWRAGETFSRYILADCLAWRGEYGRALQLARESLSIAQEIEHLEWQCASRRVLGVIALDLFDTPEALAQFMAAHDIALRLGSAVWIRWAGAPLAIALARAGQLEEATTVLDDIDRIVPMSPADNARLLTRRTLGERFLTVARAEVALAAGASTRRARLDRRTRHRRRSARSASSSAGADNAEAVGGRNNHTCKGERGCRAAGRASAPLAIRCGAGSDSSWANAGASRHGNRSTPLVRQPESLFQGSTSHRSLRSSGLRSMCWRRRHRSALQGRQRRLHMAG